VGLARIVKFTGVELAVCLHFIQFDLLMVAVCIEVFLGDSLCVLITHENVVTSVPICIACPVLSLYCLRAVLHAVGTVYIEIMSFGWQFFIQHFSVR
jgi:hypothetical protein